MMRRLANGFLDGVIKAPTRNQKMNGSLNSPLPHMTRNNKPTHVLHYERTEKTAFLPMREDRGIMPGKRNIRRILSLKML